MGYCELEDIEKYLDPDQVMDLSDDDNDEVPDPAVIAEVIAAADADLDSYLGNRYTVPFSPPVPVIVRKLSARMAIHYLYLRRKEAMIPDKWVDDYNNLLEMLREIARGEISIGVPSVGTVTDVSYSKGKDEATFTFEKLKGF